MAAKILGSTVFGHTCCLPVSMPASFALLLASVTVHCGTTSIAGCKHLPGRPWKTWMPQLEKGFICHYHKKVWTDSC